MVIITREQLTLARAHGACSSAIEKIRPGMPLVDVCANYLGWAGGIFSSREVEEITAELIAVVDCDQLAEIDIYFFGHSGYGDGSGDGSGYGYGDGSGSGYGYGDGSGYG